MSDFSPAGFVDMTTLNNLLATLDGDKNANVLIPKRLLRQIIEDTISLKKSVPAEKQALVTIVQEQTMQFASFWMEELLREMAANQKDATTSEALLTSAKTFRALGSAERIAEFKA